MLPEEYQILAKMTSLPLLWQQSRLNMADFLALKKQWCIARATPPPPPQMKF
jgi:hypothetical protein